MRKTCSCECGKINRKNVLSEIAKSNRKEFKCPICSNILSVPKSIFKSKKTCSMDCDAEFRKTSMKKRENIKCRECSKEFYPKTDKTKFCSYNCSVEISWHIKECLMCGTEMKTKKVKKRKFCSKECQYKAQSSGLVKSYSRGRYGYREDLNMTFRSSFEANFARYCKYMGYEWRYESETFKTTMGFYTPDFIVEKIFDGHIELRGNKTRSIEKAKKAAGENNFKLKIIFQDDFYKINKWCEKNIDNWERNYGKIDFLEDPNKYEKRKCKCNNFFHHDLKRKNIGLYCSIECANKYKIKNKYKKREDVRVDCLLCRNEFVHKDDEKRKFCSKECYWESLKK